MFRATSGDGQDMHQILAARDQIYDEFQRSAGPKYFFASAPEDQFVAYYTSMFLIADTGEAMLDHRKRDFSHDPYQSYLEFWGVMQAVVIQQDAIKELYKAMIEGRPPVLAPGSAWEQLRSLRIQCAGHPANRSLHVPAPQRSFMSRLPRSYARVTYETWDAHGRTRSHPVVDLGRIFDEYDVEASRLLTTILSAMKAKWP
jgi:hypothetical protein